MSSYDSSESLLTNAVNERVRRPQFQSEKFLCGPVVVVASSVPVLNSRSSLNLTRNHLLGMWSDVPTTECLPASAHYYHILPKGTEELFPVLEHIPQSRLEFVPSESRPDCFQTIEDPR